MSRCSNDVDVDAEQFRVVPSYKDRFFFDASMIDPNAMDAKLNTEDNSSGVDLPGATPVVHHKWGWWSLIAPFIL